MAESSKKIKLVISDFHLSRGRWLKDGRRNPLEDFHQDERFREFLDYYSTEEFESADVELIVNGDFFDPLAVVTLPAPGKPFKSLEYPLEVEEDAAVEKFRMIAQGHPIAFDSLKAFLARGKRIVFRWGNHDAALLWPKVQGYLREILEPPEPGQLVFQQERYVFDRICVDHGHQHEVFNHFDPENIFMERETKDGIKKIQNLPFGSFFVLGFLNRLKLHRSYITQVTPFRVFLRWQFFFEPLFFVINGARALWFFFKMRFITHPMRFARLRKTFLLVLEVFHRPSLEAIATDIFTGPGNEELPFDTIIMGHNHQAAMRVYPGGKQYINTGTWTPITSLDMSTLGHRVLRTYALIEYPDGASGKPRTSLKIWHGLPSPTEEFQ